MGFNQLQSRKFRAGLLVLAGALIAILAASSAVRLPTGAAAVQAFAASNEGGE